MKKKLLIFILLLAVIIFGFQQNYWQLLLAKVSSFSQQKSLIQLATEKQIWTSDANGWGEIVLNLESDGQFVLSYDLLEDNQVHYFKGQWQNFTQALILNFDGETPYMSQTDNCHWLDQNSYQLKIFLDNSQSVQCIEISDLILKKNNQENISDK